MNTVDELMDLLDTHPEVRPLLRFESLELIAQTPGAAEAFVPFLKNVSTALREQLGESIQRKIDEEEANAGNK